ncbi:ABC transporter permease [Dactylosporangium sucinum]|uniref:Xylose transport system permease protein XylH n=1 Tax=Dactylosporangium sucinum TaxID=1424081 RepID=A0A917WWS1_9ACTN|nr:ABC transporter permease [Dactylosporangium sucinum]GGM36378.1 sugar ABC transporter permease [Dactylosporangium sucinum]
MSGTDLVEEPATAPATTTAAPPAPDSGSTPLEVLRRVAARPELTAVLGTVLVFAFFATTARHTGFLTAVGTRNYLEVAAQVGIVAIPVTLLLVAGEFDLSVGAMIGTAGILFAYPVTYWGWGLLPALLFALAGASVAGLVNGLIVTRTSVPSFIVTLAMMFVLTGGTVAVTNSLTGATQLTGLTELLRDDPLLRLFHGQLFGLSVSFYWWVGLSVLAAIVLDRMKVGNWIYATGGDRESARKAGIPVDRVKVGLFMASACGATLVAVLVIFTADTADVNAGADKMFQAATAAVIGGALLSGGYGSPIGTAFGALLFGIVNQGFFYTSINDNWFLPFVGVTLLVAVLINTYARPTGRRRRARKERT